ncbi:MAG: hypothetical protein NTV01_10295 [Bacteroidia bacterium]|nr:hypothetical protein [Bacteroidia bacterium]
MKYLSVLIIFLCLSRIAFTQTDYWANLVYFSGCPINHIPKGITIPDKKKQSRLIMNAILAGTSKEQLKLQFSDSLEIELNKLIDGNVIRSNNNHFEITFPVLIGESRNKMRDLVHKKVLNLSISMNSLVKPLEIALKDHPKLVFHFLWSRVMDDCWWNWYNSEFNTEKGPPSIAFIVFPPHPLVKGIFDYQKLSNEFQIPADELFLVVSHEIAYEIFNMINEKKTSVYIPIIKENNPTLDFSALVS